MRLRRLVLLAIIVLAPLWWYAGHASRRAEPQVPTEICFVAAPTPYDARSGVALDAPRAGVVGDFEICFDLNHCLNLYRTRD